VAAVWAAAAVASVAAAVWAAACSKLGIVPLSKKYYSRLVSAGFFVF
jgi:hypothetical protein